MEAEPDILALISVKEFPECDSDIDEEDWYEMLTDSIRTQIEEACKIPDLALCMEDGEEEDTFIITISAIPAGLSYSIRAALHGVTHIQVIDDEYDDESEKDAEGDDPFSLFDKSSWKDGQNRNDDDEEDDESWQESLED